MCAGDFSRHGCGGNFHCRSFRTALVVAVGRHHVAAREPLLVVPVVAEGEEHRRAEVERHELQALGRTGRRARQHRLELRGHLVDERDLCGRLGDAGVGGEGGRVGRRHGHAALPRQQRPGAVVLAEEEAERGRPGARQPEAEQRRGDLLLVDLGVAAIPVLHSQPDLQEPEGLVAQHRGPELVERARGVGAVEQRDEPFVEALVAQVGEPGVRSRLGDHLVGDCHPTSFRPAKLRMLASSTSGSSWGTR